MTEKKIATLGWSRTKVELDADAVVLDVGCGAWPNEAATIACDRSLDEDLHRTGLATVVDRPFVICDANALPFRDGSIDFVIASHIAEHIPEPEGFCGELSRAAVAGYIETPSPVADYFLDEEYHCWRVGGGRNRIHFGAKRAKRRLVQAATERCYKFFYAGRDNGAETYGLPGGVLGRLLGFMLFVVRGVLNRTGVMHTRVRFGPDAPLLVSVDRDVRRVAIIERGPESGFVAGDRRALEGSADVQVIRYDERPTLRFLRETWRAAGRSNVLYTFFASEHALIAAVVARLRGCRFVVSVGGYDVANVPEHGYGLSTRFPHRLVPRAVMALSNDILAFSEAAGEEARAIAGPKARIEVIHLGLEVIGSGSLENSERVPGQVLTIAHVTETAYRRKGIDRFIDAARRDPDHNYVLVGRIDDTVRSEIRAIAPDNLELAGFVKPARLAELLWESDVYAQLSWHEGFGASLVEAMQAGCKPVVTEVPALLEVTGGFAEVSTGHNDDVDAIQRALASDRDRSAIAEWARSTASIDARAEGLLSAFFEPV
jgi:glycosyltransferase involved in cell wall biosynthesis